MNEEIILIEMPFLRIKKWNWYKFFDNYVMHMEMKERDHIDWLYEEKLKLIGSTGIRQNLFAKHHYN